MDTTTSKESYWEDIVSAFPILSKDKVSDRDKCDVTIASSCSLGDFFYYYLRRIIFIMMDLDHLVVYIFGGNGNVYN